MTDIRKININIAYKEILVYDTDGSKLYPNSNVSECDINPWHALDVHRIDEKSEKYNIKFPYKLRNDDGSEIRHFLSELNSHNFLSILDNAFGNLTMYSLEEILLTKEKFVYPIVLYNNDLFLKYDTIELPPELVECVKTKRAKICLIQATEGFFGKKSDNIIWLSNLSKKYGFEKDGLVMITSNLMAGEKYQFLVSENIIPDNVTIYPYSYFQHKLWFAGNSNINPDVREELQQTFEGFLESNRKNHKTHHFLAFSRVPKPHRLALFGELMSNEKFKDKFITSMGGSLNNDPRGHYDMIGGILGAGYRNSEVVREFYKKYDSTKHYTYDEDDLENNKASSFNAEAHKNTFVNIITESLFSPNAIFFSEKTYKPMLACQPFIMLGNPRSLEKLKEQGFKTFDKWWDESYDNEPNFIKRFNKIIDIMEDISTWDMEKCFRITNEMEEVLTHNFNRMIDTEETLRLYEFLKTNEVKVKPDPVEVIDNLGKENVLGVCGDETMTTFTELLSQKMGWDLVSFARHGTTNSLIRLQIDEIIKVKPDYVIVGITESVGSNWKKQQDTWIIDDGLRKLKEHGIMFSCINSGHLFENDLSFVNESIAPKGCGLSPTELEIQEGLASNWVEHLKNIGVIKTKSKKRLI